MTALYSFKLGGAEIFVCEAGESYVEQHNCAYRLLEDAFMSLYGKKYEKPPKIEKTPNGKPYFASCSDVFFSVSHTRGYAAVALSEKPVGMDIEIIRPVNKKIASRWLFLFESSGEDDINFTLAWTKYESLIKLRGDNTHEFTMLDIEKTAFSSAFIPSGYVCTAAENDLL